jgi:hypothetical protein
MVRILVGIHGNPSRSTSSSFLAVPGVYAPQRRKPEKGIEGGRQGGAFIKKVQMRK